MRAIICLMCVVVVAAKPSVWRRVLTYDNSFENGVWDTSLEWVRQGPSGVGPVSVKSTNTQGGSPPLPYYVNADSSEEMFYWLKSQKPAVAQTYDQKVSDLTRMLNSGYMDLSDEYLLRAVINNPERFGNRPYYVDGSGEVNFLPHGAVGVGGGPAVGGPAVGGQAGTGVQPVKK